LTAPWADTAKPGSGMKPSGKVSWLGDSCTPIAGFLHDSLFGRLLQRHIRVINLAAAPQQRAKGAICTEPRPVVWAPNRPAQAAGRRSPSSGPTALLGHGDAATALKTAER
jgi:hypothetical protein